MNKKTKPFEFAFSLEILNHLGRGLYRSFATVIAEAVSNSWDAEATRVDVTISSKGLIVEDNGKGMDDTDFQERFLKVGYSRRADSSNKSKRKVIGRKGIGKLAMLSISEKVTILSKKKGGKLTGGKIDNPKLDERIKSEGNYSLGTLINSDKKLFGTKTSGTKIIFEKIKTNLNNEDVIRKYLATQFNFVFSLKKSDSFKIFVNKKQITPKDLEELDNNTQFAWFLGKEDKNRLKRFKNIKEHRVIIDNTFTFDKKKIEIRDFVASFEQIKHILLKGSGGDFKAGVNLFTNGRLRQENIFEEVAKKTVAEEYLYGEIHVDDFEDEEIDRFTSSREGIVKNDPLYQAFLTPLEKILAQIIKDWTPWRLKIKQEGDIDQDKRPGYVVRMEDSQNRREKDFKEKLNSTITDKSTKSTLIATLKNLSYKNTLVYQDLFILENIFREYIKIKKIEEKNFDTTDNEEKEIIDSITKIRTLRKDDEDRHSLKGKIVKEDHYLNYTDLRDLAIIVDIKTGKKKKSKKHTKTLLSDAQEIGPVRNPIMHTNEVTDDVMNWDKIKNVIDYIDKLKDKK